MPMRAFLKEMKFRLAGFLGEKFVRILSMTCDGELENREIPNNVRASGRPVIYAFWHGRLIVPTWTHRDRGLGILASQSSDGEYISRIIERLGCHVIRGSSSRGAAQSVRLLVDELRKGRDVGITPDGPRGPKYEVKKGIVYLAKASGAAIVPVGIAIDRYKQFASWDEFRLMLPGAYVLARFGEPIIVPEEAGKQQREEIRIQIEEAIRSLTADCEARVDEARRTKRERVRFQSE